MELHAPKVEFLMNRKEGELCKFCYYIMDIFINMDKSLNVD